MVFTRLPVGAEDRRAALACIDTVFVRLADQMDHALDAAAGAAPAARDRRLGA